MTTYYSFSGTNPRKKPYWFTRKVLLVAIFVELAGIPACVTQSGRKPATTHVELRGIEPLSKHIHQKLSTCLFHYWLSA